jgi:hypothetical protein
MSSKKLAKFDGKEVTATSIAITNAGDGLSSALAVDPAEFAHAETVYVVLECEVTQIKFVPSKDNANHLVRVHTLRAGVGTIVEESLVDAVIEMQRLRIEKAEGKQRIEGYTEPDHQPEKAKRNRKTKAEADAPAEDS